MQISIIAKQFLTIVNIVAVFYTILLAVALIGAAGAAFLGLWPWLHAPLTLGALELPQAGMWIQLAITGFVIGLVTFLPSIRKVSQLEVSHRNFHITMDDVRGAYEAAHAEDRAGLFNLSSEFDSVRERIGHMRAHPYLARLEPAVLDVAAQMSHTSRDLASVYSDEAVLRARTFLRQRQEELVAFEEQLQVALRQTEEIKRWTQQMNVEESIVDRQVEQLKKDLAETLPALGLKVMRAPKKQKSVGATARAKKVSKPENQTAASENVVSLSKAVADRPAE